MSFALQQGMIFAGRYRIVRRLASGAMGAVYEVVHLGTNRRGALKVMHAHIFERPELRDRFELEARVTADVSSEFIVEVFDAGIDEATETPFLVMELLEGEELGQRLKRRGRLFPEEALEILHQTALALEATHRASIVHRDLKPGNVFLSESPGRALRVKVLDFGVAKIIAESASGAGGTMAVGTPYYMAPEQFRGGKVSPATDIYALGMMAYTLLVGEAYWADEKLEHGNLLSFAMTAAKGPREPASARARSRGVALPAAFDGWFARVSAAQPARRFVSATAAVSALAEVFGSAAPTAEGVLALASPGARRAPEELPRGSRPKLEGSTTLDPFTDAADPGATLTGETTFAPETDATVETGEASAPTSIVAETPLTRAPRVPVAPTPGDVESAGALSTGGSRRRIKLLAILGGVVAIGLGLAVTLGLPRPEPVAAPQGSPLHLPSSVLACPILEASGVDEPAGWMGAAAAATLCERARVILGGRAARTLVPAELLDLPRQPVDAFPVDPYAGPAPRARSLAAARTRADAYIDGAVLKEAAGFRVALVLHRADGRELARASGAGNALYQAVREAMTPLVRPDRVPRADELDPVVADWSRARDVEGSLALLDVTLAMAQNAGGLSDECARCEAQSANLGEMGPAARWFCAYTLGSPPPALPRLSTDPSLPAAYVTRARLNHTTAREDDRQVAAELQRLFEREPSALGRSLIAATESCLLQSPDPKRAYEMAFLAIQADPKNPLGEFCAPWGQLVAVTRDTASADSAVRAMQAWAPWDSSGWYMQALGSGDEGRALSYAQRAYTLTPFDTNVVGILADLLFARGAREQVRNIALATAAGGHPVHRLESDLLLVRIDESLARFGAALARARQAMEIAAGESGWAQVLRFEVAWRAVELGVILGRGAEIADLVVERFLDPEPPPLDGNYLSVPTRIPAICARASEAVGRRCFARLRALRGRLSGGILPETDAFTRGAERYTMKDFPGAARAWRPLLRQPGIFASVLPDAMALTFDRTGDVELCDRLEEAALSGAQGSNGASPALVQAARRAAKRGDRSRARMLAQKVIEAWSVADETVPEVEEMRRLLAGLR